MELAILYFETLPVLIGQAALAFALLALGVGVHVWITPYRERELIMADNLAAAILLAGAMIGLALPISASLQYGLSNFEIVFYGLFAIVVQLIAYRVMAALAGKTVASVRADQRAPALVVAAGHVTVGMVNAAALSAP